MIDLPNDIESLKVLIKQLLEENTQLKAENAKLRRCLGMDSNNSHKLSSSDGYQKKTVKPGLPKESAQVVGRKDTRIIPLNMSSGPGDNSPAKAMSVLRTTISAG